MQLGSIWESPQRFEWAICICICSMEKLNIENRISYVKMKLRIDGKLHFIFKHD